MCVLFNYYLYTITEFQKLVHNNLNAGSNIENLLLKSTFTNISYYIFLVDNYE